jgi:hypothetical protein
VEVEEYQRDTSTFIFFLAQMNSWRLPSFSHSQPSKLEALPTLAYFQW